MRAMQGLNPLSEEQLRRMVPAMFAKHESPDRSDRYQFIPTIDVVRGLADVGFLPVVARQTGREQGSLYGRHMIRFRDVNSQLARVGDVVPEACLTNSHNGSSAYNLMAALMKLACLNGMVVSDGMGLNVRVRHTGNIIEKVVEGTREVIAHSGKILTVVKEWQKIELSKDEQMVLAQGAHALRFGEKSDEAMIKPEQLLNVRRITDAKSDLWTTFNRIQENTIRGGITGIRSSFQRRSRRATREITAIGHEVKLNKALWTLAEKMAELKQAA